MLLTAIAAEVGGTTAMKFSHGFQPAVAVGPHGPRIRALLRAARADAEVHVDGHGLRDLGGLGTAAVVGIGTVFLGEGMTIAKTAGIALIIIGVVVLNLGGAH